MELNLEQLENDYLSFYYLLNGKIDNALLNLIRKIPIEKDVKFNGLSPVEIFLFKSDLIGDIKINVNIVEELFKQGHKFSTSNYLEFLFSKNINKNIINSYNIEIFDKIYDLSSKNEREQLLNLIDFTSLINLSNNVLFKKYIHLIDIEDINLKLKKIISSNGNNLKYLLNNNFIKEEYITKDLMLSLLKNQSHIYGKNTLVLSEYSKSRNLNLLNEVDIFNNLTSIKHAEYYKSLNFFNITRDHEITFGDKKLPAYFYFKVLNNFSFFSRSGYFILNPKKLILDKYNPKEFNDVLNDILKNNVVSDSAMAMDIILDLSSLTGEVNTDVFKSNYLLRMFLINNVLEKEDDIDKLFKIISNLNFNKPYIDLDIYSSSFIGHINPSNNAIIIEKGLERINSNIDHEEKKKIFTFLIYSISLEHYQLRDESNLKNLKAIFNYFSKSEDATSLLSDYQFELIKKMFKSNYKVEEITNFFANELYLREIHKSNNDIEYSKRLKRKM